MSLASFASLASWASLASVTSYAPLSLAQLAPFPLLAMLALATGSCAGCKRPPTADAPVAQQSASTQSASTADRDLSSGRDTVRPMGDDDDDPGASTGTALVDDFGDGTGDDEFDAGFSSPDGYPRAAAFDEDDDEELPDAGPAVDAGALFPDAGGIPVAADAGPEEDVDAGVLDVEAGAEQEAATEAPPPVTPADIFLSTDPSQSRVPYELATTENVRASLADDPDLSDQARGTIYVTTMSDMVILQGEVQTERERSLVQDKVEDLVGPRFAVSNMLVVRDRTVESP